MKIQLTEIEKDIILSLYKEETLLLERKGKRLAQKLVSWATGQNNVILVSSLSKSSLGDVLDGKKVNQYKVYDDNGKLVDGDVTEFQDAIKRASNGDYTTKQVVKLLMANDPGFCQNYIKFALQRIQDAPLKDVAEQIESLRFYIDAFLRNENFKQSSGASNEMVFFRQVEETLDSPAFKNGNATTQKRILGETFSGQKRPNLTMREEFYLKNLNSIKVLRLLNLLKSFFKDVQTIKSEISDLVNIARNNPEADLDLIGESISDKLNQLEARANNAGDSYFEVLQKDGTMPASLKEKVDAADAAGKWDIIRRASPKEVESSLKGFWNDIKDTWPIGIARKKDGKLRWWPIKLTMSWDLVRRFSTLLFTGQFITADAAYKTLVRSSNYTKAGFKLYFRSIFANFVIPGFLYVIDSITDPIQAVLENSSWAQWYNEVAENNYDEWWWPWLPPKIDFTDYELETNDSLKNIARAFAENWEESPFVDWENKDGKNDFYEINFDDFIPLLDTYIDDVADMVVDGIGQGNSYAPIQPEQVDNPAIVVSDLPPDLSATLTDIYGSEYQNILKLIKVEGDDIIFKCGRNRGPGKFVKDNEGWKMKWDGYDGTYTIKDNLFLDNCDLLESVKGLANILLEQPRPGTEDPDDDVTPDTSEPEDTTPSPDTPEPEDTTPVPDTNDQESDNNTDPDTTPRDQERTEYNPSNRCVEELSTSYFCLRCKEGDTIDECNQTGDDLYEGECDLFDRQKIAREISQKLACVGMRPLKKGSLKVLNGKLYFAGEKRDQETKMDFELKKTIDGNNVQWLYKDDDGQFKDFIEQYHLNEHFLRNTIGLKNILENYRKN